MRLKCDDFAQVARRNDLVNGKRWFMTFSYRLSECDWNTLHLARDRMKQRVCVSPLSRRIVSV